MYVENHLADEWRWTKEQNYFEGLKAKNLIKI
jgi:hypothetical protein